MRPRILFVSENVTLAQVVRLVVLAGSLDPRVYEVHFACSAFDELCFAGTRFVRHPLETVPKSHIDRALASGRRLYDEATLRRYVVADLDVLERVRPALVVGDLRWSLTTSAPVAGVPHAALINAYFSPYAVRDGFPLPEHPIVRLLGVELASRYFPKALPRVMDHFAAPVNAVRKRYGLAPVGSLLEVLSHADHVLHPDVPEVAPIRDAPPSHRYLGPVLWSPPVPMPDLPAGEAPLVYVTLGSSGDVRVLGTIVSALATLPVRALVATAGRATLAEVPRNVRVVPFAPGTEMARRSSVVVTNGGSSTGYQALAEGTPVLGIPFNLDQYLAMQAIERAGAGIGLRSGTLTVDAVRGALEELLASRSHRTAAEHVAAAFVQRDATRVFPAFVRAALGERIDGRAAVSG